MSNHRPSGSLADNSPGHLVAAAKQQAAAAAGSPRIPAAHRSRRAVAASGGRLLDAMSSLAASISATSSGGGGGEFSLLDCASPVQQPSASVATDVMVRQGGGGPLAGPRSTAAQRGSNGGSDGGSAVAGGGHLIARRDTLQTCFWEPTPPRLAAVRAEVDLDGSSQEGASVQSSVESSPSSLAGVARVCWRGEAAAGCAASARAASPGLSTPNSSHYSPDQPPAAALGGNSPDRRRECALRLGPHAGTQHHRHPIFLLQHEAAACSPAESCCGSPAESGGGGTPGALLLPGQAGRQRRSKPSLLRRLAGGCATGRGGFAVLGSP